MDGMKTRGGLQALLDTMQQLRSPGGCPWDAEQTPQSLAPYILEEACELIDAIENGTPEQVLDELGDLLLQVVFQAQIYSERQLFNFDDVAQAIASKLIRRHPHVFLPEVDTDNIDLERQWEKIKQSEAVSAKSCLADHLPKYLPSLQRAQKLVSKATRSGRADRLPGLQMKERELLCEQQPETGLSRVDEETVGRALFHLVRLSHEAGLDAETALRKALRRTLLDLEPDA